MRRAMSWLDFREMEDGVEDDRDILPEVASDCSPSIFCEAPKDDNSKLVEKKQLKRFFLGGAMAAAVARRQDEPLLYHSIRFIPRKPSPSTAILLSSHPKHGFELILELTPSQHDPIFHSHNYLGGACLIPTCFDRWSKPESSTPIHKSCESNSRLYLTPILSPVLLARWMKLDFIHCIYFGLGTIRSEA